MPHLLHSQMEMNVYEAYVRIFVLILFMASADEGDVFKYLWILSTRSLRVTLKSIRLILVIFCRLVMEFILNEINLLKFPLDINEFIALICFK